MDIVQKTFTSVLAPAPPFSWFDLPISTIDVVGALRLALVMRQLKEMVAAAQARQSAELKGSQPASARWEEPSYVKDMFMLLTVVYGGEIVSSSLLGLIPSFIPSPVYTGLFLGAGTVIALLPTVPTPSFSIELPLALLDGFTRALLLCNFIPPLVLKHSNPAISTSPWSLLLISLITANGGFFFVNLFSMLNPTGWSVATPPEVSRYGWTTLDLWIAPVITGLYSFWTHAQPFWAEAHAAVLGYVNTGDEVLLKALAVEPEVARARCAVIMAILFAGRAVNNFGYAWWKQVKAGPPVIKEKTQ
ncbi:hypothetical protein SISNIDRAFT_471969 [Sistotremastrum niveocremeum HHB9708]|uniref:Uncharacterized protein n=1 Tax=Sistotremastrum niveocremeum HHB9708 TaxID=1314777 RepID=A0A165ADB1_9AGAM|nr:hypothetical protein SISNIDRAFT_471969 [Sistotremastrum niveocremeum HHB9708]